MREKPMNNNSFAEIAAKMRSCRRILIFPHVNMDGDSLGSSAALCLALRALGKEAYVYAIEPVPHNLDFLESGCVTGNGTVFDRADLAVMVDCSSRKRIRGREDAFDRAERKACIDHHRVTEGDVSFDFGRIIPEAAATGELIFNLITALGVAVDLPMARALYAAIDTDTGSFRYSSTTGRTHEIVASFFAVPGFDCSEICTLLYQRNSMAALRLEGKVIDAIEEYAGGKIVISKVTQAMLEDAGCRMEEAEGIVRRLLDAEGAEIGCLLKEEAETTVRVSLRAKSYANVANVAVALGGGGHVRAAGCTVTATVSEAKDALKEALMRELNRAEHDR